TLHVGFVVLTLIAPACKRQAAEATQSEHVVPLQVDTMLIEEREVPRLIPLTGTLNAELRSELTANATGRVLKTFVERGQKVDRGALIAQLDVRSAAASAAEAKASVASAQTQLDTARAECERYDALMARGAITQ